MARRFDSHAFPPHSGRMKIELRARSSDGEPCLVTFSREHGHLTLSCSCAESAGKSSCSHRKSLLRGEQELLFDPGEAVLLTAALAWEPTKSARSRFAALEEELREVKALREKLEAEQLRIEGLLDALFE